MSLSAHWIARIVAIGAAILAPLILLTGHSPRAIPAQMAPVRSTPVIPRATPAIANLPTFFVDPPLSTAADDLGRPMLIGVAGRLPGDAEAIVRLPGEPTRIVRRGDTVMGWTLTAIAADRAVFTRGAEQHVSTLAPIP